MDAGAGVGPVLVMGAGAIGCYVGGALQHAGVPVVFAGRERVLAALREHGLTLTDLDARRDRIEPGALRLAAEVPAGIAPSLVLLAVKSGATASAAAQLGAALPAGTTVVSMQNGIGNAERARRVAPRLAWRAAMVPFNVAELGPGRYHRGTAGVLAVEDDAVVRRHAAAFERAGLPLRFAPDLLPLQWGKLLLNLNNPVNALSGLPLRAQLLDRGYRECTAALQAEALRCLHAAGIAPARVVAVAPRLLPALLRLPTPLFRLAAARLLRIDANARSSMADDLAQGRATEVDALCGEVVRLGAAYGVDAPLNARIAALVAAWPQHPAPVGAAALRASLGL